MRITPRTIYPRNGRTQALPQSPVPLSQHPRLRDAVHLNQMFSPSSEPGQSGWHILDPDGKRVMDPKKLMKDAREDERHHGSGNEEGERLKATGDVPESRDDDERGGSEHVTAAKGEEGFAASSKDPGFLPIDAPVDEEVNDGEDE